MKSLLSVVIAAVLGVSVAGASLLTDPKPGTAPKWHPHGLPSGIDRAELRAMMKIEYGEQFPGGYRITFTDRRTDLAPYLLQEVPVEAAGEYRFSGRVTVDAPCSIKIGIQLAEPDGKGGWKHCPGRGTSRILDLKPGTTEFSLMFAPKGPGKPCRLSPYVAPTTLRKEETGVIVIEDLRLEEKAATAVQAEKLGIDRAPRAFVELPYHPADGAVLDRNPPYFSWLPTLDWKVGCGRRYSYRYSTDPGFPADRTTLREHLTAHLEVPEFTLKPGKYYWQYGVELGDGKVAWSRTRAFTVEPGIFEFPFPTREMWTAKIPKKRPRIGFRPENVERDRQSPAAKYFAKRAGDFLNKRYGRKPMAEPPELPPGSGPDRMIPYYKAMREFRPEAMDCQHYTFYYRITGDTRAAEEARRFVVSCFQWDPAKATRLSSNDEIGMIMMQHSYVAYDWTYDFYTPEEHALIDRHARMRVQQALDILRKMPIDNRPYGSHQYNSYTRWAMAYLLAEFPEHPEYFDEFREIMQVIWATFPVWGGPDGGWNEGPRYWGGSMHAWLTTFAFLREMTGVDMFRHPFLKTTGYYMLYGWPGKTFLPSFSDGMGQGSNRGEYDAAARLMYELAYLTGNSDFLIVPLTRGVNRPGDSPHFFMFDGKEPVMPDVRHLPLARLFPAIGFAALRTNLANYADDIGFLFQSNPYGAQSHHHQAQNCFALEAYGEPLLIPSGYYNYYNSPHHKGWQRETRSMCGITFDGGTGQIRGAQARGRITRFVNGRDFDLVEGEAHEAYPGFSEARRTVIHIRPGIYLVRDRLAADKPHVFEYNLHGFKPDGGTFSEKDQSVTVRYDKAFAQVDLLTDKPWKFAATDKFAVTPEYRGLNFPDQWHFRASAPEAAPTCELLSLIRVGRDGKLPVTFKRLASDTAQGVEVVWPDGTRAIAGFARPGVKTAELGGLTGLADIFAVKLGITAKLDAPPAR